VNLKILKKSADVVDIEFEGESHTLLNLLRAELLTNENVVMATYDAKFPTMTNPIFHLKIKNEDPLDAMRAAASKIVERCSEFKAKFATEVE
jgi:DNA-directed RNA polymerase subunit L